MRMPDTLQTHTTCKVCVSSMYIYYTHTSFFLTVTSICALTGRVLRSYPVGWQSIRIVLKSTAAPSVTYTTREERGEGRGESCGPQAGGQGPAACASSVRVRPREAWAPAKEDPGARGEGEGASASGAGGGAGAGAGAEGAEGGSAGAGAGASTGAGAGPSSGGAAGGMVPRSLLAPQRLPVPFYETPRGWEQPAQGPPSSGGQGLPGVYRGYPGAPPGPQYGHHRGPPRPTTVGDARAPRGLPSPTYAMGAPAGTFMEVCPRGACHLGPTGCAPTLPWAGATLLPSAAHGRPCGALPGPQGRERPRSPAEGLRLVGIPSGVSDNRFSVFKEGCA